MKIKRRTLLLSGVSTAAQSVLTVPTFAKTFALEEFLTLSARITQHPVPQLNVTAASALLKAFEERGLLPDLADLAAGRTTNDRQDPEQENRITLDGTDVDFYGVPLPRMTYRISEYVQKGLAVARQDHEEIMKHWGATEVTHADEFFGAGHIMGTTRMGTDPKTSVVDQNLQCHDHRNMFLVGAGFFPTTGTANPTLTIAALSLRAAQQIRRVLVA